MGITTLGQFPPADLVEVTHWSSTPPPWERKNTDGASDYELLYREKEVREIENLLRLGNKHVVIEGDGGAGKSTVIRELAHILGKNDIPFGIFSAKKLLSDIWWSDDPRKADAIIKYYRNFDLPENFPLPKLPVLMDSGDYLYAAHPPDGNDFVSLKQKVKAHQSLTTSESRALAAFSVQDQLITALRNPALLLVTTRHLNWPKASKDWYLETRFNMTFVDKGVVKKLAPNLEYPKLYAYLHSRQDFDISPADSKLVTYLRMFLTFSEVKDLTKQHIAELRNVISTSSSGSTAIAVDNWLNKNLHSGDHKKKS